jgi:hypothetical protein
MISRITFLPRIFTHCYIFHCSSDLSRQSIHRASISVSHQPFALPQRLTRQSSHIPKPTPKACTRPLAPGADSVRFLHFALSGDADGPVAFAIVWAVGGPGSLNRARQKHVTGHVCIVHELLGRVLGDRTRLTETAGAWENRGMADRVRSLTVSGRLNIFFVVRSIDQ